MYGKVKVRKSTFDEDLMLKEDAFLKLTGLERLRLMRKVMDRMRKPGVDYSLRGSKVRVIRLS